MASRSPLRSSRACSLSRPSRPMPSRILGPLARSVVSALCCSGAGFRGSMCSAIGDTAGVLCPARCASRSTPPVARHAPRCSGTDALQTRAPRRGPSRYRHVRLGRGAGPSRCSCSTVVFLAGAVCSPRAPRDRRLRASRSCVRRLGTSTSSMIMLASRTVRFHQPRRHQTVQVHPCVARLAVGSASSPARRGCHPAS